MININKLAMVALGTVAVASANAVFYTDEATFLAATSGPNYIEEYAGWTFGSPLDGSQTSWNAPGANGYGFTASAPLGLFSNPDALSTNNEVDDITLTFTGLPVTAFGTRISNTDFNGLDIAGDVTITLSNNQSFTVTLGATDTFIGWVDSTPLASVVAGSTSQDLGWVEIDHTILGAAAVPEPASMTALAIGALAMLRRKRSK